MKVDNNLGAPRLRLPPSRMPLAKRILLSFFGSISSANKLLGKDTTLRSSSEYDGVHGQLVIYISRPGGHTHPLLKEALEQEKAKK